MPELEFAIFALYCAELCLDRLKVATLLNAIQSF
jgi:hypothetical protein